MSRAALAIAFLLTVPQLDTITGAASAQSAGVPVAKPGSGKPAVVKGQSGAATCKKCGPGSVVKAK